MCGKDIGRSLRLIGELVLAYLEMSRPMKDTVSNKNRVHSGRGVTQKVVPDLHIMNIHVDIHPYKPVPSHTCTTTQM